MRDRCNQAKLEEKNKTIAINNENHKDIMPLSQLTFVSPILAQSGPK
jgi:hypothetical protein